MVHLRPVGRPYGSSTARWKAVRFILRTVSRTYDQLGAPFGRQPRRHLRRDFLCISFVFYSSIKAITGAIYKWVYFQVPPVYDYSTWYTRRVVTHLVHQPLMCWLIRGEARQYIGYVVYLNRIESHYPNEHTILYVFRAPGYDSLVSLSWYKH